MKNTASSLSSFNFFRILILIGILSACQNNDTKSDQPTSAQPDIDSLYSIKVNLDQVQLNEEATTAALKWEDYMATQNELEQWKSYKFSEIISNAENLQAVTDSIRLDIPKVFNNKPMQARLKTLTSQADMLKMYASETQDYRTIQQQAQSILKTFVGCKRQMNEAFVEAFSLE
ncbi:MAG: hypothetical protein RI558_08260 [Psychroflexus sp.]|jgi:hypothetical protein|nr:hypothetical protein [Psychroflexus sp.]